MSIERNSQGDYTPTRRALFAVVGAYLLAACAPETAPIENPDITTAKAFFKAFISGDLDEASKYIEPSYIEFMRGNKDVAGEVRRISTLFANCRNVSITKASVEDGVSNYRIVDLELASSCMVDSAGKPTSKVSVILHKTPDGNYLSYGSPDPGGEYALVLRARSGVVLPDRVQTQTPTKEAQKEDVWITKSRNAAKAALRLDTETMVANLSDSVRNRYAIDPQFKMALNQRIFNTFKLCSDVFIDEKKLASIEDQSFSERWVFFPLTKVCNIELSPSDTTTRSEIVVVQRRINGEFQPTEVNVTASSR